MKKIHLLAVAVLLANVSFSQGLLDKINKAVKNESGILKGNSGSLTNEDIIAGLKEALTTGTDKSTKLLNQTDGYFGNAAIKILMPEEAKKAESTLRKLGMSSLADKAILSMNRAAEDAAGGVSSIFWEAIKGMTITDGLAILKGDDFAATNYLKKSTTAQLTEKMRPVIEASLEKVNATKYWKDVFTNYNKFSGKQVETDLAAYVTGKALEGLFYQIGLEEQSIRKDPAARVTDLLKKVFGK